MPSTHPRPRAALAALALLTLLPRALAAQPQLEASLQRAYLDGHRTLAFSIHAIIAAFVALRLAWRWRTDGQQNTTLRALAPGLAYGLVAGTLAALLWALAPTRDVDDINALSLTSFLLGTLTGGLAAWAARRALPPPSPRPSLEAEIARRLDLIAKAGEDETTTNP